MTNPDRYELPALLIRSQMFIKCFKRKENRISVKCDKKRKVLLDIKHNNDKNTYRYKKV